MLLPGATPAHDPRWQASRKAPQVRSDLDQDGAGAAEVDSRNRLQQAQGALVVGQRGLDARVQCGNGGVGPVDGLHLHLQREERERVECGGQGLGQRRQLCPYVACEAGEDASRRPLGDQPVEHPPPVDAEDVRQDTAEPEPVVIERLVDAVAGPTALADEAAAIAGQLAQLTEKTRGDVAWQGEAELADAGQPQAVVGIGLFASDLLDVLSMKQVGVDTRFFQRLEWGLPVDAGAFPSWRR